MADLLLNRKIYSHFEYKDVTDQEKTVKQSKQAAKTLKLKDKMEREQSEINKKREQRIEQKKNLIVAKNIRATERSRKPELRIKKKETVKITPEEELLRKYLGIMSDDWQIGAQQQQVATIKEEEEKANSAK